MITKRIRKIGCALMLVLGVVGPVVFLVWRTGRPYRAPTIAFQGDSRDLEETIIVPTLDTPVPEGKNIVWCGTLQLAWGRLAQEAMQEPPDVEGAAAVVARLNGGRLGEEDLPSDCYFVAAGLVKDGVADQIQRDMKQRFQEDVVFNSMSQQDAVLLYAFLNTHVAFTIPFFEHLDPFEFTDSSGANTLVTSFGIREKDDYAYFALRSQVEVLYRRCDDDRDGAAADEFVLDLCRDSTPNQIVLARVEPKATLADTLEDVNNKIRGAAAEADSQDEFGPRDVLLIPNLNWEIHHRFTELEGRDKPLRNRGWEGYHIAQAAQTIRFKLDRSGAELASQFKAFLLPGSTHYLCNRPFLVFIRKRGKECPFFVLWVDNAELLSKP